MLSTPLLLVLLGCPDAPPTDVTDAATDPAQAAQNSGSPATQNGDAPPPASASSFEVEDGDGVKLSGVMSYGGSAQGSWRLDVLSHTGNGPPSLLASESIAEDGAFSFDAPSSFGPIYLMAFVDVDADGPSPTDPAGVLKVLVEADDIDSLEVKATDNADLGELAPPAPGAASDGPPGNDQPDGEDKPAGDGPHGDEPPPEDAPDPDAEAAPEGAEGGPEGAVPEEQEPAPEGAEGASDDASE